MLVARCREEPGAAEDLQPSRAHLGELEAASTLGIRHLHGDRLRPVRDISTKKAAFLHSDLLRERWKTSATGLAGIFTTLCMPSSCR